MTRQNTLRSLRVTELALHRAPSADFSGYLWMKDSKVRARIPTIRRAHYIPLTADSACNEILPRATVSATAATLAPMVVLGFAADERLIRFDNTNEFAEIFIRQAYPDAVAHGPRRAVAARADRAVNLDSGNSFLAGEHEVNDAEPLAEGIFCVFEYRPDQHREAIGGPFFRTLIALPIERHGAVFAHLSPAAGASDTLRPAARCQISATSILSGKRRLPLAICHLMDAPFGLGHGSYPSYSGGILVARPNKTKGA